MIKVSHCKLLEVSQKMHRKLGVVRVLCSLSMTWPGTSVSGMCPVQHLPLPHAIGEKAATWCKVATGQTRQDALGRNLTFLKFSLYSHPRDLALCQHALVDKPSPSPRSAYGAPLSYMEHTDRLPNCTTGPGVRWGGTLTRRSSLVAASEDVQTSARRGVPDTLRKHGLQGGILVGSQWKSGAVVGVDNGRMIKRVEMHVDGYEDCVLYHCTPVYSPDMKLLSLQVSSGRWLGNDLGAHERLERLQELFTTEIQEAAGSGSRPRIMERIRANGEVRFEVSFRRPRIPIIVSLAFLWHSSDTTK